MDLRREPFDVRPLAVEIAEGLERLADANGVDLQVRIPDGLPLADGDRDRIRQVVANLVENAVTYTDHGGHVEIAARRLPSGDVRIAVVDDGIGIPTDMLPRLTDRFFRVDKSRARQQGGTGPRALDRQAHSRGARAAPRRREPAGLRLVVRVHAPRRPPRAARRPPPPAAGRRPADRAVRRPARPGESAA